MKGHQNQMRKETEEDPSRVTGLLSGREGLTNLRSEIPTAGRPACRRRWHRSADHLGGDLSVLNADQVRGSGQRAGREWPCLPAYYTSRIYIDLSDDARYLRIVSTGFVEILDQNIYVTEFQIHLQSSC